MISAMDEAASAGLVNTPEPFLQDKGERLVYSMGVKVGSREWCAETTAGRHPSTVGVVNYFAYADLPARLQDVSAPFAHLAQTLLTFLSDSPELTVALRKLIEAKDCAVRAMVDEIAVDAAQA